MIILKLEQQNQIKLKKNHFNFHLLLMINLINKKINHNILLKHKNNNNNLN